MLVCCIWLGVRHSLLKNDFPLPKVGICDGSLEGIYYNE